MFNFAKFSTSPSSISPHSKGPTPAGVPVNIKSPEDIEKKLLNYTHHYEFELSGLDLNDLKKLVEEKKIIYDHSQDQKSNKFRSNTKLSPVALSKMPDYLKDNYEKYSSWLDI